jgi:3-deoxy-D-manno-octulosonate 8-phosphate phosphatase KdsC-like HAD superfamily phosphatase
MKNIKLILFNVQGVMIDSSIYIEENGESLKILCER